MLNACSYMKVSRPLPRRCYIVFGASSYLLILPSTKFEGDTRLSLPTSLHIQCVPEKKATL